MNRYQCLELYHGIEIIGMNLSLTYEVFMKVELDIRKNINVFSIEQYYKYQYIVCFNSGRHAKNQRKIDDRAMVVFTRPIVRNKPSAFFFIIL